MGIDYYGVLQINRTATNLEIKKAYRALALEFNPEKLRQVNAARIFALICEAYEVLSDPLRREVYDQFGEEGLKRGVPSPQGFIEPYHYHGQPMRTYRDFFGTVSPYADLLDILLDSKNEVLVKRNRAFPQKQPTIRHPLALTLHEIFFGGFKKMKINRLVFTDATETHTEIKEKILTVPFKPGIKTGTEILFPEEGDQNPNQIPADVVFVVEDRPHEYFSRDEDNLIMTCGITLEEALLGCTITINTVDHRTIRIPITDVVTPEYEKVVEGEGMPILERYPERGDLILRFEITFPKYLSKASKGLFYEGFNLVKVDGGLSNYETIDRLAASDKMFKNDQCPT